MKLYHSMKPHPVVGAGREVRIVVHEKQLQVELIDLDMLKGENREPWFLQRNPAGQLPVLELDDGTTIAETGAILEFLEESYPDPPMIGETPAERAATRMWQRRIELGISENIANGWRFSEGQKFWKTRGRVIPEAGPGLKAIARDKLRWLDAQMDGRAFIVGARFTVADVGLLQSLDFGDFVGQPLPEDCPHLRAWRERLSARPSVAASLVD